MQLNAVLSPVARNGSVDYQLLWKRVTLHDVISLKKVTSLRPPLTDITAINDRSLKPCVRLGCVLMQQLVLSVCINC